ncbi:hypothetical protein ABZZ20_36730 [Streptomyces sp. NPDC006430]|uniref:hypothetical protein n=1 Tax=Streptomyces sp. NPDC006430 TaxID=3154299 RepID=UPI00339E3310
MAGGVQQSNELATRNGVQALEMAYSGILRCRQDVDGIAGQLAASYGGTDGSKFGDLLRAWDGQANVILRNLESMVEALNMSLKQHNMTQGAADEAINQAYNQSLSAFDALRG